MIKGLNRDGEENRAIKIDYLFLKRFKKSNVHYKMEKQCLHIRGIKQMMKRKNWSKSKESLRIYGITDDGKTTCLIVNDFKPFVHIELPSSINWRQKIGGQPKVQKIMDYLNFILGDLKPVKNRTIFIDKYKLYGSNYVSKHLRECFKEKSFRI